MRRNDEAASHGEACDNTEQQTGETQSFFNKQNLLATKAREPN
jgi:hypothetical protein